MVGGLGRWGVALGVGAALALGIAACGGDDGGDGSGSGSGSDDAAELEDVVVIDGSEADVTVLDNTFNDENIQVAPGTRVVWTNNGRQDHDIVATDGGTGFGVERDEFQPEAVYEYTFEEPGTYRYFCSLHGTESAGMIGAVVVEDGGDGGGSGGDGESDEDGDDQ
jgi:plastocyanin